MLGTALLSPGGARDLLNTCCPEAFEFTMEIKCQSLLILNYNLILIPFSLCFSTINFIVLRILFFTFKCFVIIGSYFIKLVKIYHSENGPSTCLKYSSEVPWKELSKCEWDTN